MSGSIGRSYLIQSWSDASSYSGEMIGNRLSKSNELFLPSGKANLALFDEAPKKKPKAKKRSIGDRIDLANAHYERMEAMSNELDNAYFAGEMDNERYALLRIKMNERLHKAWKRLSKENGWEEKQSINSIENKKQIENNNENKSLTSILVQAILFVTKQLINRVTVDKNGFILSTIATLRPDNSVRKMCEKLQLI
jgi:hypothetical protein